MRILALDVGEKRIGVARADSDTRIAVPVGYIDVNGLEWQEIARIANLNSTALFVIGLPRSNDGNETAQSAYVRNFARDLTQKIPGAKVSFQDESLTSVMAEERLKSRGKAYEKGEIDAEAAAIILQDFLEGLVAKTSQSTVPATDTPKTKRKMGMASKVLIGVIVLALIAGGAVWGIMWYRNQKAAEREAYYAQLEAEMTPEVFTFTIVPGETIYDVKDNLEKVGYSRAEIDEAFAANYNFSFLQGRPEGATLEGYLFGETHEFYKTDSVKDILTKFLEGTGEIIAKNDLASKYAAQGLSLYEGITLASIVQKESPTPEMPTVAQVFLSRLAYGMPLGSDVTVSYALDTIDPDRVTYTDNQAALAVDSCYNTRLYTGLPCGPISNPSLAALLAVASPTDTSYLYFLTGDDGMMYYSYTEAEHNQNAYSHCQSLCSVSL